MPAPRVTARTLLLLTLLLLYAVTLGYIALRLSFPSDGARLAFQAHADYGDSVSLSPLRAGETALRPGDYVLRVDGHAISTNLRQIFDPTNASPGWQLGQTVNYTVIRGGSMLDLRVALNLFPLGAVLRENLAVLVVLIFLQGEAAWIWSRRRDERAPQVLLLAVSAFCMFSVCWYLGSDIPMLVNAPWLILGYRGLTFTLLMVMCSAILHFSLILPRRNEQPPLPIYLIPAIYLTPFVVFPVLMALLYSPSITELMRRWEISMISLIFVAFILALLAFLYGYRHIRHRVPRLHVRIIAVAFAFAAVFALIYGIPIILTGQSSMGWNVLPLLSLPVAFGLAIAVIFYRLFDILVVIQRTLVWGALTALIVGIYVVIVGSLSIVFDVRGDPVFSLIATGVSAVMFQSARTRLQALVNRLVYGGRDTPYEVVTRITQEIEAVAPEEVLLRFVQTVGMALKLPYSALELWDDGRYQSVAAWGKATGERVVFPLTFHGKQSGRLVVSSRALGEALTAGDQDLLRGVADQAELLIEMGRLNSELQMSREKLMVTREDERRRLHNDLHDGLGPTLASMTLQIDAARNWVTRDPDQAEALLVDLKAQVKVAVADVRRLVDDLRPSVLDNFGLVGAIREQAHQFERDGALTITINAPAVLPPLSTALEVAAYRIVSEAMTNVVHHAQAKHCIVTLALGTELVISIQDNGRGLPEYRRAGASGINSMSRRAAELGGTCRVENLPEGGTMVCAHLGYIPLEQPQ